MLLMFIFVIGHFRFRFLEVDSLPLTLKDSTS